MVDKLKVYFGDPYPVSENITIHSPTIQGIVDYGETDFYSMLFIFIGNTTYRKLFLWKNGIDWNTLSDFELFCNFAKMLKPENTSILLGDDIDLSQFDVYVREDFEPEPEPTPPPGKTKVRTVDKRKYKMRVYDKSHVLYNEDTDMIITADDYFNMRDVLRCAFQIYPKTEYASSKDTAEILIQEEEDKLQKAIKEKGDEDESNLQSLISFAVNHPGFKYNLQQVRNIGIAEFMDSIRRLQLYESTRALLAGSMSGFADMSKVPQEQFDFTRSLISKK